MRRRMPSARTLRRRSCVGDLPLVAEMAPTLRTAVHALNLHAHARAHEIEQIVE